MISRTAIATQAPNRLQMLAAGQFSPDTRELAAISHFERDNVIEHRVVRFAPDKTIAEVRTNGRMTQRFIFQGYDAHERAVAWCESVAPHATWATYRPGQRGVADALDDDDAWRDLIDDEIDAQPLDMPDFVTADYLGMLDAQDGQPCQPEKYYARLGDIESYIISYKDTLAAVEAAQDYADDILDREWHSRGGW